MRNSIIKKWKKFRALVPFNTGSRVHRSRKGKGSYNRRSKTGPSLHGKNDHKNED
jgi:stalled ribosome alternative rescue factor ArfA